MSLDGTILFFLFLVPRQPSAFDGLGYRFCFKQGTQKVRLNGYIDSVVCVSGDNNILPFSLQERMFRRSRISVRPNVGRPGRAGATAQGETPASQGETPADSTPAESTGQTENNNNTTSLELEDNSSSTTAASTSAIQR